MKSFTVAVAVPPDRDDTNIIRGLTDSPFLGSLLVFIYKENKKIRKAIEYAKTKKDTKVVKLKGYYRTTLHGDVRIWNAIKDNLSGEYVLFIRSTIPSVPTSVFNSDNLPDLVLASNDPQRRQIQEFLLVNSGLLRRYTPDKDLPFLAFLQLMKDNNIRPMWTPTWTLMDVPPKFPQWLYVEITTKCNLDCKYCIRDMRKGDFMDFNTFKQITTKFDKSKLTNIVGINLIGLGEVLLHPDFSKICNYVHKKEWMLTLTTNGTIRNKEIFEQLPPRTEVYFSLDGTYENGIFKQNRNISPKYVMDTIKLLRQLRPKINITIQPVIVKGFINEALSLASFANSVNAKIHPTLPVLSNKEIFDEMFPSEDEIRSSRVILSNSTKNLSNNLFDCPQYRECQDPFMLLLVLINGDVYPCCFVNTIRTQKDEHYRGHDLHIETDQYILGNIFDNTVKDIVQSPTLYKVRDKICRTFGGNFDSRNEYDMKDATEYCKVCLARWKRGC